MNQADTAWMLVSTALVLLMTPALAFFYGGLVRSKNVLNTMMMTSDWCGKDKLNYSYVDGKPVTKALVRAGERALDLQIEDGRYLVPIGERGWPDDALIELTFAGAR